MTTYASLAQEPTLLFAPAGWTDGYVTGSDGVRYAVIDGVTLVPSRFVGAVLGVGFTRSPPTAGIAVGDITGLGSGVAAFLATPSSANLRTALTDESGTGAALFAGGALGTPASGTLTNCTGPWAMERISQVVTTSSATTITFSSIPGTYTNLRLILTGRDTQTSAGSFSMHCKINSDGTAGNYTNTQILYGAGSSATATSSNAATTDGAMCGNFPGVNGNANAVGTVCLEFDGYAQTTFYKVVRATEAQYYGSGPTLETWSFMFAWKSTAAITTLVISKGSTAFVDGTTATLYGVK